MNRRQFIESRGATCRNWQWSWSFVNAEKKIVIFGEWDVHKAGNLSLILSEDWKISRRGKKQPAYAQSIEHIRLVEEEHYQLMTFPMEYSASNEDGGVGPAKIKAFKPELSVKSVIRIKPCWYSSDGRSDVRLPEELAPVEELVEGASKSITVNSYERNAAAKARCLEHYGYACSVCSFDFEAFYGVLGRRYIHVHHHVQLSSIKKRYVVDPIKDLVPICPNCHAMIHRSTPVLGIEQLRDFLKARETCITSRST